MKGSILSGELFLFRRLVTGRVGGRWLCRLGRVRLAGQG